MTGIGPKQTANPSTLQQPPEGSELHDHAELQALIPAPEFKVRGG